MRLLKYYFVVLFVVAGFLALNGFTAIASDEPAGTNKNIIKFSHEFHSEVTDCASCHTGVPEAETLSAKLLPSMDDCSACHDVEDEDNCEQCHYEDVYEALVPTQSTSLNFNHKLHVTVQKMECTTCHKGLDEVEYSFESAGKNPAMDNCYQCHNNTTVANNCESCHKATGELIPADHKTASFFSQHKFKALDDKENCQMCHDKNDFCEACHVSTTMIDETNTMTNFYVPYAPHQFIANHKIQQITRVHSLDYRFSHGIDARGKTSECQTCHQVETFCAECHGSTGGDFAAEGFAPTSHLVDNYTTIGNGSGGGAHAIEARRDIESCASCHDTQGADPTCIICHFDNDGVKNTNPRTHPAGFMRDQHGDWHEDMGSVCYNCHTDINASPSGTPGIGFCGYCHGSN